MRTIIMDMRAGVDEAQILQAGQILLSSEIEQDIKKPLALVVSGNFLSTFCILYIAYYSVMYYNRNTEEVIYVFT